MDQGQKDEYKAAYEIILDSIAKIEKRVDNGYRVAYNAIGTPKSATNKKIVAPSLWGSYLGNDPKEVALIQIHLCERTFKEDVTPAERAGTILHELSHLVLGTDDLFHKYGPGPGAVVTGGARNPKGPLNDAYWFEDFCRSENANSDTDKAMQQILDLICSAGERNGYYYQRL